MVAPKTSRRLTVNRRYDMPNKLPKLKDAMRTNVLIGRIDLSYDPVRYYGDIDLDTVNFDNLIKDPVVKASDIRFMKSMNILEDWRVIDECVKESDCYEASEALSRIASRARRGGTPKQGDQA